MNGSLASSGPSPHSRYEVAQRPPALAGGDRPTMSSPAGHNDDRGVGLDELAAWGAALDPDHSTSTEALTLNAADADALLRDPSTVDFVVPSTTNLDVPASGSSSAGATGDKDDSRPSPPTRFEILLADSTALQVDFARQLTHWSLSLRTTDAATFGALSRSRSDLSAALEQGFGCEVAVEVTHQ